MHTTRMAVLIAVVALGSGVSGGSESHRIEVQSWQAPQKGWLYVVDPGPLEPRILLFNPDRGKVTGTIRTGYNPDIALSPSGDRLYLASGVEECGGSNCDLLAVIDTRAGRVLSTTPIPDRVHYKVAPESSRLAATSDGRTVYLLKWQGPPNGDTPVALAAFDTLRTRFLDGVIDLGNCGFGTFVPVPERHQLGFHCPASNDVVVYRLTEPDRGTLEFSVHLPWGNRLFARQVYTNVSARAFMLSADRRRLFAAGGDGAVAEVNLTFRTAGDTPVIGAQNEVIAPFASPGAADRARLYAGAGAYDGRGLAEEIRVFDTNTWVRVGTIPTSAPFLSAVATRDGSMIYAMTGEHGQILAIDPVARRELRAMPVGRAPSLALIAP